MDTISFKRHRFPPDIIRHAVWLYARFTLSYRDVEDFLAERGLDISYESVRRWFVGSVIGYGARSTMEARSWMFPRAIETKRQGGVEVDAQTAEETRLGTHPDHNR